MQPRRSTPPLEARSWGTIEQQGRYTEYRRNYYLTHRKPSERSQRLNEFRENLKRGIQNVARRYKRQNFNLKCGCWYLVYENTLYDRQEQPKSTWKRELRKLGWLSKVTYLSEMRIQLPPDHPGNRRIRVEIAWEDATQDHLH